MTVTGASQMVQMLASMITLTVQTRLHANRSLSMQTGYINMDYTYPDFRKHKGFSQSVFSVYHLYACLGVYR